MEFRPADHAMGLELQIEELMEQHQRAQIQGRGADARRMAAEIEALHHELAATAEVLAMEGPEPGSPPHLHNAEELSDSE